MNSGKRDWSVSLGAGRVAPSMYPAKFGFYTDVAVTPSNCDADYVVYALDVPGSSSQANMVALHNLYSGTTPDDGLCNPYTNGSNSATVYWAYNTSAASCAGPCKGAGNLTSPSISFDANGSKVAFVESVADNTAICPGRVGTGPCSIFHVLAWKANEGTVSSPQVPGQAGSAASLVSITYASAANSSSSAWIDYANDVAYVGADDGKLYRITGVFYGTPTLDGDFTMDLTAGPARLSPPVQLSGTFPGSSANVPFNVIIVGDGNGNVWAIDVLKRAVLGNSSQPQVPTPVIVGGNNVAGFIAGALDAPIVYYDPSSDPRHIVVFAGASSSANSNPAVATRAAMIEALIELDSNASTFDDIAQVPIGLGATATQAINIHAPAFDNAFFTLPMSGSLYACGTHPSQPWPYLYRIAFTNPLPAPRDLVPVMNVNSVTSTVIANATTNAECSPLTEFPNPNLVPDDLLFFGVSGNVAAAFNWNIAASAPSPIVIGGVPEPGGTSGIVVDNVQLTGGMGSSQGSSIYFGTLKPHDNCAASSYCAVKLRQIDLN